jgi:hypothetical protein
VSAAEEKRDEARYPRLTPFRTCDRRSRGGARRHEGEWRGVPRRVPFSIARHSRGGAWRPKEEPRRRVAVPDYWAGSCSCDSAVGYGGGGVSRQVCGGASRNKGFFPDESGRTAVVWFWYI